MDKTSSPEFRTLAAGELVEALLSKLQEETLGAV